MVDKAVQSPIMAVGILVHEAGDKVRGNSDDKSLQDKSTALRNSQDGCCLDGTGPI